MTIPEYKEFKNFENNIHRLKSEHPEDFDLLKQNENSEWLGHELSLLGIESKKAINVRGAVERIQEYVFAHPEKLQNPEFANTLIHIINDFENLSELPLAKGFIQMIQQGLTGTQQGTKRKRNTDINQSRNVRNVVEGIKRSAANTLQRTQENPASDLVHITLEFVSEGKKGYKEYDIKKSSVATASPVLKAILDGMLLDAAEGFALKDQSEDALDEVVKFFKTGNCEINNKNAFDLLRIADKYEITDLKSQCEEWIAKNFNRKLLTDANYNFHLTDASIKNKIFDWAIKEYSSNPGPTLVEKLLYFIPMISSELEKLDMNAFLHAKDNPQIISFILDLMEKNAITHLDIPEAFLTPEIVAKLSQFPNLQALTISSEHLQDDLFIELIQHCPHLQSLDISCCYSLTDASIHALAQNCPHLKSLNVTEIKNLTDAALFAVAQNCKDLQHLDITECELITDASISAISENKNLKRLICTSCSSLTDASISAVAQNCKDLLSLECGWCYRLTDTSISAVAQNCKNLLSLDVRNCMMLSDHSILDIAERCQDLLILECGWCKLLTDASISAIAQNCKDLQRLDVHSCNLLTDTSISAIVLNCPNLESLSCSACPLLTDASISLSAQKSTNLKELFVNGCDLLTDASINALAKKSPPLQSLHTVRCPKLTLASLLELQKKGTEVISDVL